MPDSIHLRFVPWFSFKRDQRHRNKKSQNSLPAFQVQHCCDPLLDAYLAIPVVTFTGPKNVVSNHILYNETHLEKSCSVLSSCHETKLPISSLDICFSSKSWHLKFFFLCPSTRVLQLVLRVESLLLTPLNPPIRGGPCPKRIPNIVAQSFDYTEVCIYFTKLRITKAFPAFF